MITTADIRAMCDVVDQLAAEAGDSGMSAETALPLIDAVKEMQGKAKFALELLETAAKVSLESAPRVIGDKVWATTPEGKWRPDQSLIRSHVSRRAQFDENAELLSPEGAAARAVDLMYSLFVAPQTMPKDGGLRALGLDKGDVAHWEKTGTRLSSMDLTGGAPE